MISFFPTPYPDELWYSVICRYHVHSGNLCAKYTLRQLYGSGCHNASLTLCGQIDRLLVQLPKGSLTAKQVILRHTLYPYYARFLNAERKRSTYAYVCSGDPLAAQRLGIYQANGSVQTVLRYCPQCFAEDIVKYGEPYWHREHQLAAMQICLRHQCRLAETDICLAAPQQEALHPAVPDMTLAVPCRKPIPKPLMQYSLLIQAALQDDFNWADGTVYHAVLDRELRARGWRSLTGGRTYAAKIERALLDFYGTNLPTADLSARQLHATLCSGKTVAPRYLLQLAAMFGLTLQDLLKKPKHTVDYKKEMQELYRSGASLYHIGQLYKVDAKTAARWARAE